MVEMPFRQLLGRPNDIIRLYLAQKEKNFSHVMKFMARSKSLSSWSAKRELNKISESDRHGGVCIITKRPLILRFTQVVQTHDQKPKASVCAWKT